MLSNLQKRRLVMVARRAFEHQREQGAREGDRTDRTDRTDKVGAQDFDGWRHAEVARACGKVGLRCCENRDYPVVMAHFLHLLGEDGAAMEWHLRAQSDGRRQAEAVLQRELGKAGLSLAYVEAICRSQFKCGVLEASEKQVWSLVYTVRNRGAKRKRDFAQKGAKEAKGKEVVPF